MMWIDSEQCQLKDNNMPRLRGLYEEGLYAFSVNLYFVRLARYCLLCIAIV